MVKEGIFDKVRLEQKPEENEVAYRHPSTRKSKFKGSRGGGSDW